MRDGKIIIPLLSHLDLGLWHASLREMTRVRACCVAGCLAGKEVQSQWIFFLFHSGYHAENFQAGSKGSGDLILVLISPQSSPRIYKSETSCLSQILLIEEVNYRGRPNNFELWSLLGHLWAACSQRESVFRLGIDNFWKASSGLICLPWIKYIFR